MKHRFRTTRRGFTLVEIMIVVAIIALLAVVAIPSALRARKRSQATTAKNDLRLLDAAIDQYAIEQNKVKGLLPSAPDLAPYAKTGSRLGKALAIGSASILDVMGNEVTIPTVDSVPMVAQATFDALSDVADADFWKPYYDPAAAAAPGPTALTTPEQIEGSLEAIIALNAALSANQQVGNSPEFQDILAKARTAYAALQASAGNLSGQQALAYNNAITYNYDNGNGSVSTWLNQ